MAAFAGSPMSVGSFTFRAMAADTPAPAFLRSLEAATQEHPLDRKLLLCRTIGEGRELLRALAVRGCSWLGWEITTPRRLALDLVGAAIAGEGRAPADDYDQEAGVDIALHEALADDPGSPLARLADTPGFRAAVAGAVRELGLAGIDAERLRRSPHGNPQVRALLVRVLEDEVGWESPLVASAERIDLRAQIREDAAVAKEARHRFERVLGERDALEHRALGSRAETSVVHLGRF